MALLVPTLAAAMLLGQRPAVTWPKTEAEQTNYAKTSSYADVVGFLNRLQQLEAPIRVLTIGSSPLGKDIPLVVCHRDPSITPSEAKRQHLPVVYLQANIHAGEVEGKEAVLMLLRELAQDPKSPILSKLVLLVQPIYNSDGNDKWGSNLRNRGHQDGPDPVGERANGGGLDLNRDCIKAESPEMRAALDHVYNKWDPDVLMDLHTTNGTRHGYVLTYSPCLNPTSDAQVLGFTRDTLLPAIRKQMRASHGWNFIDYGNVERRNGTDVYATFGWEPRYVTNYAGTRNRIAVLSEAASFQPFRLRVESTLEFVRSVLFETVRRSKKVVEMNREADARWIKMVRSPIVNREVGIRFEMASRGEEPLILEVERPQGEIDFRKAPTQFRSVTMPVWDRFRPTRTARVPRAYLLPSTAVSAANLLIRHGIAVERLEAEWSGDVQKFVITEFNQAASAFQGHRLISLEGKFASEPVKFGAGSFLVRADQKLGLLAFHLLEPESLDGIGAWGGFGDQLVPGTAFPVVKLFSSFRSPTRQVLQEMSLVPQSAANPSPSSTFLDRIRE